MVVNGIELAGIIGTVKAIADIIEKASETLRNYRHSDEDVEKFGLAFQADSWTLKSFVRILRDIDTSAKEVELSDEDRKLHEDVASVLQSLEARLRKRLAKITDGSPSADRSLGSRSAWALWRKRDVARLEKELEDWIRRIRVIYTVINAEIERTKQARNEQSTSEGRMGHLVDLFSELSMRPVHGEELFKSFEALHLHGPRSRRMAATIAAAGANQQNHVVAEYIYKAYSENLIDEEIQMIGDATQELASVLYRSNPEQTRILKCDGYFHDPRTRRFGLIYELPPSRSWVVDSAGEPRILSLRELLNRVPHFPLNHRLRFCCDVAQAVLYVHLVGWVHKSIRPDNILVFDEESDLPPRRRFPHALPSPYLAGFEYARSVKSLSDRKSDAEWHVNIYRHPKRQLLEQNAEYTMAHDIYSLGVVLLELALWGSNGFLPFQKREAVFKGCTPEKVKEQLLDMAVGTKSDGVAVYLGQRFGDLVAFCLNIDEKQEMPSASFVSEVWLKLDEIRSAI